MLFTDKKLSRSIIKINNNNFYRDNNFKDLSTSLFSKQ